MAMGMSSNKKRSNVGVVVVRRLVLGLALLVAEAAGKDISYCQDLCRGRPYFQYIHCIDVCMLSSGHGAAARLAGNRRTAGEEGRIGGVGLGGRAGLLAIPAEHPGREVEEKTKQEGAGHLTELHGDAAYCSAFCNGRSDFGPCYNECLYGRVTGQEEARGGGGAGLLAMPTERAGGLRFGAHGREVEEEARGGGGGADGEAKAKGGGRVVQLAFEPGTAAYCREFCEYEWDFATCNIKCLGKKEEIHVGGRAGLLVMPTERAGREEEEKRKKGT